MITDKQTFYSNGKLLIIGEYLVLDGAVALAVPTKFGQSLTIKASENKGITWTSYDADGRVWLEAQLTFNQIINNEKTGNKVVDQLINILFQAHLLDDSLLSNESAFDIETRLTFPRLWGLGTSSTLINNIAQWFKIDAFELLKNTFGGSGYDIACAKINTPILYRLLDDGPKIKSVLFNPPFKNNLYFIYLNQKQNSQHAITAYLNKKAKIENPVKKISKITKKILETSDFREFCHLLDKHEVILSDVLEQSSVKESLFPDFDGHVKSLGAWGGDFVLVASEINPTPYFQSKGFKTILAWDDMVL